MDRVIEKKSRSPKQWIVISAGALVALVVVWQLFSRAGSSRLKVDTTRITIGTVEKGQFVEYFPSDGTVAPAETVYLDIEEGGRVDSIYVEGGQEVKEGQLLLRFSNPQAERTAIETETRLLETLDTYRNTEFSSTQSTIQRQETLLELDHQIIDTEAKFKRYDALMGTPNSPISQETYETTRDQLKYLKDKRALMQERMRQEEQLNNNRLTLSKESITRLNEQKLLLDHISKALVLDLARCTRSPVLKTRAAWCATGPRKA